MSLDHLWAGWRADYVASVSGKEPGESDPASVDLDDASQVLGRDAQHDVDCVFCRILSSEESDEARYIVHQGTTCVVMLNAFPYASGHMLVMPKRHLDELDRLDDAESAELWHLTQLATRAAKAAYAPEGINLGANLGRAAGAGIPRHLHLHIVPRWIGDTNFMTAVASVRVMPEALSSSWRKLSAAWPK